MKTTRRLLLPSGLAVVTLIIVMGLTFTAGAYERKSSSENKVKVVVSPVQLASGRTAKFEVRMTTHSVELNQDIVAVSTLKDNNGHKYRPLRWTGSPPGGHHREGVLEFPAIEGNPNTVTLFIRDIAGVPQRIFEWKLER
ncbi:MAG: hypothetical protein V3S16_08865 [Candidatus Desulfatibia sp.]|uniref:hypothetical protein n=1 Tax=Candidatus Desulfatibia sp. TaxID=3101189 RepID=UPI002F314686